MNGIPSLYQMTPTGVPFRTGIRGEPTSEQRYFVPGFSTAPGIPLTPEQQADRMLAAQRSSGASGYDGEPTTPSPISQMTPTEQANYYAVNPTMGKAVQTAQSLFGLTSLGMLQKELNPSLVAQQHNIARGIDPTLSFPVTPPAQQDVSPIAPVTTISPDVVAPGIPVTDLDVNVDPTVALTQMNQQQEEEDDASPAAVAADVAATVAATADAVDADAGASNAAAAAAAAAGDGGGGGGGGDGGGGPGGDDGGGPGDAGPGSDGSATGGADSSASGGAGDAFRYGGQVMNYNQGGVASLANRVQEKGRGQDTMLVHMTPKEVGGLQALAMAHGGSLTINPQTGLPEAGFLSSILPMVAGAALAPFTGGLSAALLVGGGYGLATGSLSKGLMAGLGAFGGAGLGSALSAAGAASATAPALTGTAPGLAQAGAVVPQAAMSAAPGSLQAALPTLSSPISTAASAAAPAAASTFAPAAAPVTFGNMASGIPALGTEAGRTAAMSSLGGGMGAIKTVGMAAAPLLAGGFDEPAGLPIQDQFIRPFKYRARPSAEEDADFRYRTGERGESTGEQRYFGSEYTPVGVYKAGTEPAYGTYAMGGDIEEGLKNGNIRAFDDEYGQDEYAGGGLTAFKAGGLQDGGFVVTADVVSHLGN